MPGLVLGPIVRYVDERVATVWLQADAACEVDVLGVRERTWCVDGLHFALVVIEGLARGEDHPYEVLLDGELVWPQPGSAFPASTIRLPDARRRCDVAESCGTSRKTITAPYHEDLGDNFERPNSPFEQQLSRARAHLPRIWVARAPATETLRCAAGDHHWERLKRPGAMPRSCPEDRSARHADVIERAAVPARAAAASDASTSSDGRPRGRRERRGATLRDAATSPECVVSVSATQESR